MKASKIEIKDNILRNLIKKIVYETRTCPEDLGLTKTYPKCDGCVDTDKANKCITCFKYAILDDSKPKNKIRL